MYQVIFFSLNHKDFDNSTNKKIYIYAQHQTVRSAGSQILLRFMMRIENEDVLIVCFLEVKAVDRKRKKAHFIINMTQRLKTKTDFCQICSKNIKKKNVDFCYPKPQIFIAFFHTYFQSAVQQPAVFSIRKSERRA